MSLLFLKKWKGKIDKRQVLTLLGILLILVVGAYFIWQNKTKADTTIIINNPGFESDLQGWSVNYNIATPVSDVKHSGEKSLKANTAEPIPDSPDPKLRNPAITIYNYVDYAYDDHKDSTLKVSAWVNASSLSCNEKAGAYISVAYTETNSNASPIGGTGGGNDYGTRAFSNVTGWQLVEADLAVLPPQSTKFVRIGLHISGKCKGQTGGEGLTAWFDDVSLIAIRGDKFETILKNPSYRETLYMDDPDIEYSADFPKRKNILVTVAINNPIPSSTNHDFNAKLFKKLADDTSVMITEQNLNNVTVNDGLKNIKLTINEAVVGDYEVKVSMDGGTPKTLPFVIKEGTNTTLAKGTFFDINHRAIVDGSPFFPLGFYMGGITTDRIKFPNIDKIADSGFNTVLDYGYAGCDYEIVGAIKSGCLANGPAELAGVNTFFDAAKNRGLKVVLSIAQFLDGNDPWSFQKADPNTEVAKGSAGLREAVNRFKNEDSLLAWYSNDEISNWYLNQLKKDYQWINGNEPDEIITDGDPNHPVYQVLSATQAAKRHRSSLDVLGVDKYPNFCNPLTEPVCKKWYDASNIQAIASVAKKAKTDAMDAKPVWMVLSSNTKVGLQANLDKGKNASDSTAIPPTYEQVINMSYQALAEGARGIFFWWANGATADGQAQWVNMSRSGHHLDAIKEVALGIDQPADQSIQAKNTDGSTNTDLLTLTRKGADGKYYLLAVNLKEDVSSPAKFVLPTSLQKITKITNITPSCPAPADPNNLKQVTCTFGSGALDYSATDKSFSNELEALGVRIFKLETLVAPVVKITNPAEGTVIHQNFVTVYYTVNGEEASQNFYNLNIGNNKLDITAYNPDDETLKTTVSVNVVYEPIPNAPDVVILSPANDFVTYENFITVTHKIDGVEGSTKFENLNPGPNKLEISATNASGTTTKAINVIYKESVILPPDSFGKGWNMVSFPDLASSVSSDIVSGTQKIRQFVDKTTGYVKGENTPFTLTPGAGYWMNVLDLNALSSIRYDKVAKTSVEIPVKQGWNLLGNPFDGEFPVNNMILKYKDGSTRTYAEAIESKTVVNYVRKATEVIGYTWSWNQNADRWDFVAINPDNYNTSATKKTGVEPYRGFWMLIVSGQISSIIMNK